MRTLLAILLFASVLPAQDRMDKAMELARQQKYQQALDEFLAIVKSDPANKKAAMYAAAMEFQTGRMPECIARTQILLKSDPKNADMLELLGQSYMATRDWKKAEDAWRAVLKERPSSDQAHMQLGAVLLQYSRFESALFETNLALEINSRRADIHSLRGNILASLGRMQEAAQEWAFALNGDPSDSVALSGLAVYLRESDPDRALALARRAVDLNEGRAIGPYRVLALVYRARGDLAMARTVIERALLSFPNSDMLAAELRSLKNPEPAGIPAPSGAALTLGASARDLQAMLTLPNPPGKPAPPPKAATNARNARSRPAPPPTPAPTVVSLASQPPNLARGALPLSAIVPPFVYADVVAPYEEEPTPASLADVARRLREQKEKETPKKKKGNGN